MSSVNRVLHDIFTKSLPGRAKAKAKAKAKAAIDSLASNASNHETHLQKLVHDFKSSCDNRRFRHSKGMYTRNVRQLADAKQFSMVEDILEHQKRYDDIRREGFAIRLIELYGISGMFGHARKLFDELPELNCPRTVKSFNALLKACVDANNMDKVVEVFEDLPRRVLIEPNLISFNTVIHALCQMGSIDDALSRFHELESCGKEPNVITFNILLNAVYSRDRFSEGENIWAMMKSKHIAPDVRSYNSRLRGMFCKDRISEAVELVGEMKSNGVEPDSFTYNALIRGFSEKGNLEEAKKWYVELRKSECTPNLTSSYSTIVLACHEAGDLDKAFEVCLDARDRGLALQCDVVKQVIDGLVEKGMTEEASKIEKLVQSSK